MFPILNKKINGKKLVYLDNSATSLTPTQVVKEISSYYNEQNANVHRGIHTLSNEATEKYESIRRKVAKFINATQKEIIFTKGTTESLNLLAYSLCPNLKEGDEIVLSKMEHHSNIVPWQALAKKLNLIIKFINIKNGQLDLKDAKTKITNKTKIVSIMHVSNVLGTINPIKELAKLAHQKNAIMIVDGAQSIPHLKIDVKDLDCDFFAFSGHKMCGPTGVGILYGKKEMLENMNPFLYGGDMISEVSLELSTYNNIPFRFEAGTPNIAGVFGLGKAIDYLNENQKKLLSEKKLIDYTYEKLSQIEDLELYGPKKRLGVFSFNIKNLHALDVATFLDEEGIAVRSGHHCAMPLMKELNINGCVRASLYFYNTKEDIDSLYDAIIKTKKLLGE